MAIKKGLGRGFSSLIPDDLFDDSFDPTSDADKSVSQLRNLDISKVHPDENQPRSHFDEEKLAELAESIVQHGVLQPIVVTPGEGGTYVIVAGERRYRASKLASKSTIPAIVRSIDGQERLELALIENIQRRDLNPIELATAYGKLRNQFNMTLDAIRQSVGAGSVSLISNRLRLLKLPREAQQAIVDGTLTEGQARPLIDADPKLIDELLPKIIAEGWSVRKIEALVRARKDNPREEVKSDKPQQLPDLSKRFETNVTMQVSKRGAGKFIIQFANEEERARIESMLK